MTYHYYGVKGDFAWKLATQSDPGELKWFQPRLLRDSDVVWCQGPRGGVRIVHINHLQWIGPRQYGYISQNSKAMQEFMWIKLKAQSLNTKLWN
jgi:hypothetical protein